MKNHITVTDDRSEILAWLSPLEPHLRHHDIQTNRVMDVGGWLLRKEEFQDWMNGDGQGESQKAAIFCSGNLGVGKTYISSLVIDTLCDTARGTGEDIAVAYFYFDSSIQKEQSAASVLGALLKQVVCGLTQMPETIADSFRRHKKFFGGRKLQLPEMVKILGSLSSSQRTFFCLDAVDECAAPDRAKILLSLKEIIEASPASRVFLTGRPHVGGEVGKRLLGGAALISISPPAGDIVRFIYRKLAEDTALDEMDERLEAEIVEKIPETFSDIFLLVSLNLDAILQETTIHQRRERLQVMTDGLGLEDAYGGTLDRIKEQDGQKSRLGIAALMWICHSERPLGAEELCQALMVEIGSVDYNGDNAPSIMTVLNYCQGFVVVDEDGSTLRLIHYTLHEYLTSHRNLFRNPHSTIAETCLTYLNSQPVMALSNPRVQGTQHSPFLEYSSLYWGAHMKEEFTDLGRRLALKLFSHSECHISTRILLEHTLGGDSTHSIADSYKFTGLHYASMFGLVQVARALTMMEGVDINSTDETGATPLLWAARGGHKVVVNLFLRLKDTDPDKPDCNLRTPLSCAAENGHEAVVKLLLERKGVKPNRVDLFDQSPISWAAENGHEAVVKLLLEREDVRPDWRDEWARTPISWAARNGHTAVVKLLLERGDVNPDKPDRGGRAPISWAAGNGHDAVVKILLGRTNLNPNRPDNAGQTPVMYASGNGHDAVVKLLRGRQVVNRARPGRAAKRRYRALPLWSVGW